MWGTLEGLTLPTLRIVGAATRDHPVVMGLYFVLAFTTLVLLGIALWRGEGRRAYWWSVAFALVSTAFSWGDDTIHHVYRVVALAEEYRAGAPGMLLTNPTTGQVLPVFVFYSVLPYLPATFLNLLGVPAWFAFKLVLVGQYLVLALGLLALLDRSRPADSTPARANVDYLIGILFLLANYVFTLWVTRAALAELWVYALVPWVALSILTPGNGKALVVLFFVQAVSHPIVLAQALICEIAVPFCIGRLSLGDFVRRWLGPLAIALLLAAPFWAPQFVWQDLIVGPAGFASLRFEDSFLTLTGLMHGRDFRSIGPFMPVALVAAIVAARARLDFRFWLATGLAVAVLLVQWVGVRDLVSKIPVLNMSVFVWRLMLPAAFLAFGAILVGWRQLDRPPRGLLSAMVLLSAFAMLWASMVSRDTVAKRLGGPPDDRVAWVEYDRGRGTYGVIEFLPRLDRLPALCPVESDVQRAAYNELRRGLVARKPYVAVRDGAHGFVSYTAPLSACQGDLVLGPVRPGDTVRVSERSVNTLFVVRMTDLALLLVVALILFLPRRRPA